MLEIRKEGILLLLGLCSCTLFAEVESQRNQSLSDKQIITRNEQIKVVVAPESHFSGEAKFSRFSVMPSGGDVTPAIVHFSANSRTHWHIHHHGQYLIVTEGEGQIQAWGQSIETIKKGDVVWCPPGVKHWHGASFNSAMTHIAISPVSSESPNVTWLEHVDMPVIKSTSP